MKFQLMLLTLAITAFFSAQALACGGCGCEKGDDDEVTMSALEDSALFAACGGCGCEKGDDDDDDVSM